jgi:hypothetical protein
VERERTPLESVGYLVMSVVNILLSGFVLTYLWNWFVVPLDVYQIGIAQALGLTVTARVLAGTAKLSREKKSWETEAWQGILIPLVVWGTAWVIHLFM